MATTGSVAAFTGHMVDVPGRIPGRFPPGKVEAVREAIKEQLERLQIRYGFSSAARGSDLLFVEELLKRHGCPHIFLPFPKDDFARTSVGYGWNATYYNLLSDNRVEVTILSDQAPATEAESLAYERCNAEIQNQAISFAHRIESRPVLLTVWNGEAGGGQGGTADAVEAWRNKGYDAIVIDVSNLPAGFRHRTRLSP